MRPCISDSDARFVSRRLAQVSRDPLQMVHSTPCNPPLALSFDKILLQSYPVHLSAGHGQSCTDPAGYGGSDPIGGCSTAYFDFHS